MGHLKSIGAKSENDKLIYAQTESMILCSQAMIFVDHSSERYFEALKRISEIQASYKTDLVITHLLFKTLTSLKYAGIYIGYGFKPAKI